MKGDNSFKYNKFRIKMPLNFCQITLFIYLAIGLGTPILFAQPFEYLSPQPGTSFHSCQSQIIVRPGVEISDRVYRNFLETTIYGSESGTHLFQLKIVEGNQTVLLIPEKPFLPGEVIEVEFSGEYEMSFNFRTESENSTSLPPLDWKQSEEFEGLYQDPYRLDFPEATVVQNGETSAGFIYGTTVFNPNDLFVLDNSGMPVFTMNTGLTTAQNFRYLNDTLCVYASINDRFYLGLDTNFQIMDTFKCVNDLTTDFHEMLMTDSGNVILMSFDQQIIDMSQIVTGGHPAAVVTGLVLQEIDPDDNLVFQWRSWDQFQITDGLYNGNDSLDFTSDNISYVHCNSIEIDHDGHWIISSRHMGEVTKINRTTGEIVWRMGGKNNEFTFIEDPLNGFNLQHDARRTPDGTITIFDNGVYHEPKQTRIVEYALDEDLRTATLVWSFSNPNGDVTQVSGNAQRLENGNTFINWGKRTTVPIPNDFFLEVDSLGNHVFEMGFVVPPQMGWIYRAYRLPFKEDPVTTSISSNDLIDQPLQLFPNPVSSTFSISFVPNKSGRYQVIIFNLSGYEVLGETFILQAGYLVNKTFSTQNILPGNYFVRINYPDGKYVTRQLYLN